ncbi:MAG TPA: trypsin-like serine protease [Polyangia bacterium]
MALLLALAGCTGAAAGPAVLEEGIIGGTSDTSDPAVVLLYMTVPGQSGGSLCTGEIVSPHVVLTAAHCTGGENPAVTNAVWRVYLGADFSKATAADLLAVKEAHYNSKFDINNLPAGNDVGVAIMQSALPSTIAPLPYNRASMDSGFDGNLVRFVGYGLDNAAAQTGAGVKRTTTTTLTDHTALVLHFADATHETCNGDSGGPALMTLGGKDTIVGLTSYGDVNCSSGGWDTRVDAMAAWIDGYVQQADPGFIGTTGGTVPPSSTPPSPSGGSQSPPTSSATPMPPSSTGAGGVGASCVSDNDCQTRLCGLANNGSRMCFAANANQVVGGCSLTGRASDEGGVTAAALLLILALIGKLERARGRVRVRR